MTAPGRKLLLPQILTRTPARKRAAHQMHQFPYSQGRNQVIQKTIETHSLKPEALMVSMSETQHRPSEGHRRACAQLHSLFGPHQTALVHERPIETIAFTRHPLVTPPGRHLVKPGDPEFTEFGASSDLQNSQPRINISERSLGALGAHRHIEIQTR